MSLVDSLKVSSHRHSQSYTPGIADFVRLRAGLAPSHWRHEPKGKKWDAGYETTAYFLDYVDKDIYPGFVACVNEWLGQTCVKDGVYDERQMFEDVMPGWDWNLLWDQWCEKCR
jgi:Peptidase of plants and bacteria